MLSVSFLAGCCVFTQARHPDNRTTVVDELKSDTIAFVMKRESGEIAPWCAGVWIDKDKVLTADHCMRAPLEAVFGNGIYGDESEEEIEAIIDHFEMQLKVDYVTSEESNGIYQTPDAIHTLKVVKHDKEHDLALLVVDDQKDIPKHTYANIAKVLPAVGDELHIVGHPAGLIWTYVKAIVGSYREKEFQPIGIIGPFIQVIGPVWKGNSGGGAYNQNGELVGIASFITPAPNQSMFVHLFTIREFLKLKN